MSATLLAFVWPLAALSPVLLARLAAYGTMIMAVIAMLLAHRHVRHHGTTGGRIAVVLSGLLVFAAVAAAAFLPGFLQEKAKVASSGREARLQTLAYEKLGEAAVHQNANARVLILRPDLESSSPGAAVLDAKVAALREGLSRGARAVREQRVVRATGTRGAAVSASDFDLALDLALGDANLIVVLGALPHDYASTTFHRQQDSRSPDARIRLAVADVDLAPLGKLIQENFIVCALIPNPKFDPRKPPTGTPEEILAQRFLYLTPGNVAEITQTYPGLFPRPRE